MSRSASARANRRGERPPSPEPLPAPAVDSHTHLVFGGELKDLGRTKFRDLAGLDVVGIYPNYASAYAAWKGKAQATVDNAMMRYFIVHLHRLLDPEQTS